MTKDFFFLISYLFFLVFSPALHAQQNVPVLPAGVVCVDDYNNYYKINDDHSYTLTLVQGNQSAEGAETLPDCFYLSGLYAEGEMSKKYTVRDIGPSAFTGCQFVTAITLPAGVKSIGEHAFSRCSALTTLELPAGLTSIGNYAFEACEKLTDLELPSGLTSIGLEAFYECRSLTQVTLPDALQSLGGIAFKSCSALKYVSMPSSLLSQANKWDFQMFQYCSSELVHHVRCPQLPTSAEKAQMTAAMESFNRGSSKRPVVWTVPPFAWDASPAHGQVQPGATLTFTSNIKGLAVAFTVTNNGVAGAEQRTEDGTWTFPQWQHPVQVLKITVQATTRPGDEDVEIVPNQPLTLNYYVPSKPHIFAEGWYYDIRQDGSKELTLSEVPQTVGGTVTIPSTLTQGSATYTVTEIGPRVFSGRGELSRLELPESLTTVGEEAFEGCVKLTDVYLPSSVAAQQRWPGSTFARCSRDLCFHVRCARVPDDDVRATLNAALDAGVNRDIAKPVKWTVPAFEWNISPEDGSDVKGGQRISFTNDSRGLAAFCIIKVSNEPLNDVQIYNDCTYQMPASSAEPVVVLLGVSANAPKGDKSVEVDEGWTTKFLKYTVAPLRGAQLGLRIKEQGTGNKQHSVTYDLSGRPVGEGHRGIVIENGKLGIRDRD